MLVRQGIMDRESGKLLAKVLANMPSHEEMLSLVRRTTKTSSTTSKRTSYQDKPPDRGTAPHGAQQERSGRYFD